MSYPYGPERIHPGHVDIQTEEITALRARVNELERQLADLETDVPGRADPRGKAVKRRHMLEHMEWGVGHDCSDYHPRNDIPVGLRIKLAARAHAMTWRERHDDYLGAIGFFVCIVSAFCVGLFARELVRAIF